jgi:hypothetical protein
MVQLDTAMAGFRTVMNTYLSTFYPGFKNLFYQDDNVDVTNLPYALNVIWDMTSVPCGVGGDYRWDFMLIIECYFKSGQDPNVNYMIQANQFFEHVLKGLEDRQNLDLFLQNGSFKLIGNKEIRNYPFQSETPGRFKKIISTRGYIHNNP